MKAEPFYICGPTASGKTSLALELAAQLDGEVVNADAFQLYRGLEIISAAPSAKEKTVIDPQPDGVAAWMFSGEEIGAPPDGAARFYVVLSGEVRWRGETLPRLAVAFSNEAFHPAATDGTRVLCVQFPC